MAHALPLVILGTGGNSVDVLDTVNAINARLETPRYHCAAFLDDNRSLWGKRLHGVPVKGPLVSAHDYPDARFVLAVGGPDNFWWRERIADEISLPPERYETIVHPTASVSQMSFLGPGSIVLQNVTIASNVRVGRHGMILPNTVISHDGTVGDFACMAGGVCVSGNVRIGRSCYLGTNSSIIGHVTIGDRCLIGMGSVILDDVPANSVYVGVPGRFLRPTCDPGEARPAGDPAP